MKHKKHSVRTYKLKVAIIPLNKLQNNKTLVSIKCNFISSLLKCLMKFVEKQ